MRERKFVTLSLKVEEKFNYLWIDERVSGLFESRLLLPMKTLEPVYREKMFNELKKKHKIMWRQKTMATESFHREIASFCERPRTALWLTITHLNIYQIKSSWIPFDSSFKVLSELFWVRFVLTRNLGRKWLANTETFSAFRHISWIGGRTLCLIVSHSKPKL